MRSHNISDLAAMLSELIWKINRGKFNMSKVSTRISSMIIDQSSRVAQALQTEWKARKESTICLKIYSLNTLVAYQICQVAIPWEPPKLGWFRNCNKTSELVTKFQIRRGATITFPIWIRRALGFLNKNSLMLILIRDSISRIHRAKEITCMKLQDTIVLALFKIREMLHHKRIDTMEPRNLIKTLWKLVRVDQ